MHESHLIEPLIQGIAEQAKKEGGRRVSRVRLKVGEFTGVKKDSFRETFSLLSKGTILNDAKLEITFFPGLGLEVISFDIE
ncbi:hydrogenase maturation nickel metallochaperone HypA [candidate division NPL-UPA2 bacterium]|nr:hydrogenase maturation nickel metallochaperone HypA [candidate division NPL-UPA2 bacterium]